jgi:glutamate dehydrogenase
MVLDRHRLGIHLLVHPMLTVSRNDRHELTDVDALDGRVEAWTLIELDRCPSAVRTGLEDAVRVAIDDVHSVVRDFDPMQERLVEVAAGDPLMQWLADENFVLLGSAIYERSPDGLSVVPGSLLGQYRSHRLDPDRIDPPTKDGDEPIVIARTDAVATLHRPGTDDLDRDSTARRRS